MNRTIPALATVLLLGAALASFSAIVLPRAAFAITIKNEAVGKPLKEAQELARNHQWREAIAKAREADAAPGKTGAEAAAINQFIAYAAVQAGDIDLALSTYDRMISAGEIDRTQGLKTAMELALSHNMAARGMDYANKLGGDASGTAKLALASINYQQGRYQEVIRMLRPGAESAGPDVLEMLRSAYYKAGDKDGAQYALELLLRAAPTPEHWRDAIRSVEQLPEITDHQNLDLYRLKLAHGAMQDANDYVVMAEMALEFNCPNEAKTVLTKGYQAKLLSGDRNQRLMDKATQAAAQDQSTLPTRDKQASANPDGNADVALGENYSSWGRYADAQTAIERGIRKDKLKDPDDAKIRLGQALFGEGKRAEAEHAFNSVPRSSKQSPVARLWALYAERG